MIIKLAIVDNDVNYTNRLLSNLQINYADKIEPYIFTSYELLLCFLQENNINVVLISESISIEQGEIPENISFAWLVSNNAIEKFEGRPAIGKFQKTELLYKSILRLYADMESKMVLRSETQGNCVIFTSAQGGVGTSTLTAAYALHLAREGHRPLYINLDKLNSASMYFSGDGIQGFSQVIFALKSRKGNLPLKLESIMKKDATGVLFFDSCKNPVDMLELHKEDIDVLFAALNNLDCFDYLVVDLPLDFSPINNLIFEKFAGKIIFLSDGSDTGNMKFEKALEILKIKQDNKEDFLVKSHLLLNKIGDLGSDQMSGISQRVKKLSPIGIVNHGKLAERLSDHPAMKQIR